MDKNEFKDRLLKHGYCSGAAERLTFELLCKKVEFNERTINEIISVLPVTDKTPTAAIKAYLCGYSPKIVAALTEPEAIKVFDSGFLSRDYWEKFDFSDDEILNWIEEHVKLFISCKNKGISINKFILRELHNSWYEMQTSGCSNRELVIGALFSGYTVDTVRVMKWLLTHISGVTESDLIQFGSYELGTDSKNEIIKLLEADLQNGLSSEEILNKIRQDEYFTESVRNLRSSQDYLEALQWKTPEIREDAIQILGVSSSFTKPISVF